MRERFVFVAEKGTCSILFIKSYQNIPRSKRKEACSSLKFRSRKCKTWNKLGLRRSIHTYFCAKSCGDYCSLLLVWPHAQWPQPCNRTETQVRFDYQLAAMSDVRSVGNQTDLKSKAAYRNRFWRRRLWCSEKYMSSFGPEKIRSMHSAKVLYFCHQCRELHERLRSVGVCAVT